jgi:hypothetical protein
MGALDRLGADGPAKLRVAAAIGDTRPEPTLGREEAERRVNAWPEAQQQAYDDAVQVLNRQFPHGVSMMLLDRIRSDPRLVEELAKLKPRLGGRR